MYAQSGHTDLLLLLRNVLPLALLNLALLGAHSGRHWALRLRLVLLLLLRGEQVVEHRLAAFGALAALDLLKSTSSREDLVACGGVLLVLQGRGTRWVNELSKWFGLPKAGANMDLAAACQPALGSSEKPGSRERMSCEANWESFVWRIGRQD